MKGAEKNNKKNRKNFVQKYFFIKKKLFRKWKTISNLIKHQLKPLLLTKITILKSSQNELIQN